MRHFPCFLLLVIALSACVSAPTTKPADVPLVSADLGLASAKVPTIDDSWWQAFGDVQLDTLIDEALHHVDDPWNLRHYRDRVPEYYPDREELAYSVLDIFAGATGALGVNDVMRLLAATPHAGETSRRGLIDLIELLEQDHYLRREGIANSFRSEIVRRAWMATWR